MDKKTANTAILQVIANIKQKIAELDTLDDQFVDLDASTPMENVDSDVNEQFDLLADKREELEQEIRSMRERVQLISEWEKFKGGEWSEDIKAELDSLDQQFTNIADGASLDTLETPSIPPSPVAPEVPEAPVAPPTPETPEIPETPEPIKASLKKRSSEIGYLRQTLEHILDLAEENIPEGGDVSGYSQIAEWAYNALNKPVPPPENYEKFSSLKRPNNW